jgi:hypothetical protein
VQTPLHYFEVELRRVVADEMDSLPTTFVEADRSKSGEGFGYSGSPTSRSEKTGRTSPQKK